MNRSPCPPVLPGSKETRAQALASLIAAGTLHVPPGMTLLQESAAPPPARLTPELLRERGIAAGQTDRNVSLHEQMLPTRKVQVLTEAVGEDGRKTVTFRADIAVCDVINLNWRFYPRSAYEAANLRAAKAMEQGKLTALLEHPGWEDSWKGRLDAVAARWTKLGIEDREIEWPPDSGQRVTKPVVFGEGVLIGGPAADVVRNLLEGGVFVGISTNGYSNVKWVAFGDLGVDDPTGLLDPEMEIPVTGDDLTYLTIDFVSLPANSGGQTYAEHASFAPLPERPTPAPTLPAVRPPPTPQKESSMHPKIAALCVQLNKTLDQIKTENQTEYLQALESIAAEQNTLHTEAARVPGLTAEIARITQERDAAHQERDAAVQVRVTEARTSMVDAAIESANLPVLAPYQDGETTVDLAGAWRTALLAEAIAADSDAAAQALVNRQVAARQHLLGPRQTERANHPNSAPPRSGKAPTLPGGNNDQPDALTESTDVGFLGNGLVGLLRS